MHINLNHLRSSEFMHKIVNKLNLDGNDFQNYFVNGNTLFKMFDFFCSNFEDNLSPELIGKGFCLEVKELIQKSSFTFTYHQEVLVKITGPKETSAMRYDINAFHMGPWLKILEQEYLYLITGQRNRVNHDSDFEPLPNDVQTQMEHLLKYD